MEEQANSHPSMRALQAIDRRLGPLAGLLLRPLALGRRRSSGSVRRLLVIKFWGLGSLQLATPAIRALRRQHPGATLTLLTLSGNRDLAEGLRVFDEVRCLDLAARGRAALALRLLQMLRELRDARYDQVYDFEFFTWFSALASLASGAPRTFGFAAPGVRRGGLHTDTVPFNRYWHVARNFRALAGGESGADITPEELSVFHVHADHERELDLVLEATNRSLVVINPNAGDLAPERRWPAERFGAVAARLVREDGAHVVITGSPSERDKTSAVLCAAGPHPSGSIQDLGGALSIGALHALFRRAQLVISNDSGPMHLAAAQGAPTLGLFGPETPVMYAPIGRNTRVHYAPPLCSPCINVHDAKVLSCIHGQPECLMRIEVEEVLASARALLVVQSSTKREVSACASSS
jgi:lipopolysaccharide heptosyltransferase II